VTASNFGNALAVVLSYEGGYSCRDDDPGGATNLGVTLATLAAYRGRPCTAVDVQALTRATVGPIYQRDFWTVVSADDLPSGLDLITFDASVNQGPGTAARMLQRCAGVGADGAIGPVTLAAIATTPAAVLIERMRLARLAAYQNDGGWATFGAGWSRRVNGIAQTATDWAGKGDPRPLDPIAATRAAVGE
jgi:lysozyme family protein